MQTTLGWIIVLFSGFMFLVQLLSAINFSFAQKIGLQEKSATADPLLLRAERYTAYWDLVTIIWLPVAGILMLIDHALWPYLSLIGAAIYIDAAGREAAKNFSFRHEGIRTGTKQERKLFYASYVAMIVLGLVVIVFSLQSLLNS